MSALQKVQKFNKFFCSYQNFSQEKAQEAHIPMPEYL